MQINVGKDSPARRYKLGIAYNGKPVENDLAFYLLATAGFYKNEIGCLDLLSSNWVGYVGISAPKHGSGLRDIAIAFRGTQVRGRSGFPSCCEKHSVWAGAWFAVLVRHSLPVAIPMMVIMRSTVTEPFPEEGCLQ